MGFEEFCGGQFWNDSVTWNTDQPDFTQCFQNTVLYWGPSAFLLIVFPFYVHHIKTHPGPKIAVNKLNASKTIAFAKTLLRISFFMICPHYACRGCFWIMGILSVVAPETAIAIVALFFGILLIFITLLDMFKAISEYASGQDPPLALIVSPAILAFALILAVVLMQLERLHGSITSGILFIFWFLCTLAGVIPFYTKILHATSLPPYEVRDVFRYVTFYLYYAMILVQLILSCFAEKPQLPPDAKNPSPELSASFLSRITFHWLNRLVLTGYRKSLEEADLFDLHPRDQTKYAAPKLEKAWDDEMKRCNWRGKTADVEKKSGAYQKFSGDDERTPLLDSKTSDADVTFKGEKKKDPSLLRVLTKLYGCTLLRAHICKLICDILTFVGPVLQSQLITFTQDATQQTWKGYFFASLFFVQSITYSLFFHQLFFIAMNLGMRIKAALIQAVYKKALTMSNEARKDSTVGEIVNLMSVDAQRMQDVTGYLWMLWSCPLQIAIAIYMLWGIMGPATLAGLGVMILLIPVNAVMATMQRRLQIAQMTQKDSRIKLMNEVLNGIKVLKLYAWELSFRDKVNMIRNMELETLRKYAYLSAFGTFTWTCAPFLVTLVTFLTYVLSGHTLDANTAFVSLSLFNILRFPINLLPMMVSYVVTASVSIKRLSKFLKNSDIDFDAVQHNPASAHPITVEKATFSWGKGEPAVLKNINMHVKDGSLTAVVGQVGSGKSSLISAVLGEMEKIRGWVNVRGSIAYASQQAWIQNATLKDNILFGKPYDAEKYDKVLEACALKPDLAILPGGDMTEIGEKGINLSGGQKQRVSVARAVYNDADLILLDDPLSAVDSHVGKHMFEKVLSNDKGVLAKKTRILVTHGVQWLPMVDTIVVMNNGEISEMGTYEELLSHDGPFAQFLKTYLLQEESDSEEEDEEINRLKTNILQRVNSISTDDVGTGQTSVTSGTDDETSTAGMRRRRRRSTARDDKKAELKRQKSVMGEKEIVEKEKTKVAGEKLIEAEKAQTGQVKLSVFFSYAKALGLTMAILMLIFFALYQTASVLSNVWLSQWTDDPYLNNKSTLTNTSKYAARRDMYLGVYGGLGGIQALFVLIYSLITASTMVRASRILHENMLMNILRSPMSFFDTTPIGRIVNRFSRDIETIDNLLPQIIRSWMNTMFTVVSTAVVISYSTPIFLVVIIPLIIFYYFVQRFYIATSRQLKRLESTTRSPIYVSFSETITGASTIRAYGYQDRFVKHSEDLVDHNLVFYFGSTSSNRWLGFRLETVGGLIVLSAAMFAVIGRGMGGITGGLVGLSISYALQITQSLNWMVRMTSDLETNVVSVERVKEYSETPTEAQWYIDHTRPHRDWPHEGRISFEDYSVRYREELDLVLRGITFNIQSGEKVGIVGRTGAGKSSLTLALFRIIEAAGGSIIIDGVHIANLGLHHLRSKLTILPQDPVLFSGSLRMNLDPFDKYTDEQVWQALEHSHLKEYVNSLAAGLEHEVGEGGQNLSVGQRQLVCLARTLLRKTKFLILDEATAAVDLETDELIQNTIRTEFADCTVLTIAHRLNTILDSDRVIVLDKGKIEEFDSPANLLKNKRSIFYSMAKDAGIVTDK